MSEREEVARAIRGEETERTHPWADIPEPVRTAIQNSYLEQADFVLSSSWLTAHDASVARTAKAEAWREGWNRGFRDTQAGEIEDGVMTITPTPNPYEQEPTA